MLTFWNIFGCVSLVGTCWWLVGSVRFYKARKRLCELMTYANDNQWLISNYAIYVACRSGSIAQINNLCREYQRHKDWYEAEKRKPQAEINVEAFMRP